MPHLRIDYSSNLDAHLDVSALCKALAEQLAALKNEQGNDLFPLAGTRVLAYPAAHHAVAGGREGFAYMYLNLRITPGRSRAMIDKAGNALLNTVQAQCAKVHAEYPVGITLHIEELTQAYEGKFNNLTTWP